ncbi:hypothetical protein JCM10207_006408 [Rhodosporidiobolus poonsookiae]
MPAVSDSMLAQLDLYQLFLDSPKPSPSLAHLLRSSTTPTVLVVRDVGSVWEVAIDEALTTCRIRDIEVFWHELEPGRVHAVSPSLWRWAKERKAKLALEGAK